MSPRGRKPDPSVDLKIKEAATSLLFTKGFDFTMDEVAEAAGVGRASVFRRYATKRDLLLEALSGMLIAHVPVPDTGSFRGDLTSIVVDTLALWHTPGLSTMVKQSFAEAGRDPAIAEVIRTGMQGQRRQSWAIFERAIERGELAPEADLWLLSDLLAGLVAYRGLLDLPMPEPEPLVEALISGFAPR